MPEVIMPKMGDAMVEGKLLQWTKQDGAAVKQGDIIAEIETDKSNVEVEAEDTGILRIRVQPGALVPVGEVIATIGDVAVAVAVSPAAPAPLPAAAVVTPPRAEAAATFARAASHNGSDRVKASPLAKRVAKEKGIDIAKVKGSGPSGRIIEADVVEFVDRLATPRIEPIIAATAPVAAVELSAVRKVIARRMTESKTTIPHFYLTVDIDMTEAVALREKLNAYDDTLPKISVNDMIVRATAKALGKMPAANVAFRDNKIQPGAGIHVGIAVALDDGLIVPVVRDADRISLRSLAQTSKELVKRAREKKLRPEEYSGGTFTVSNLGGFDVESFIAIIDPAQGAILAVSTIVRKPVVLDDTDTVVVRQRMNATFSGDHRAMDGAVGARFMQELKRILQNPLSLLE
jgi:pyruvate dehydrogenase E2 component (dihydrolipoamide acetyltransferase)